MYKYKYDLGKVIQQNTAHNSYDKKTIKLIQIKL